MPPVSSQRIGHIEGRLDRLEAKVDALGVEMRSLHGDTLRQMRESEATLREEMQALNDDTLRQMREGDEETRRQMREGDEETRRLMREGDEETRRLMRLLHEDVIDRIKTLGDALQPPR
jgi:hypothetical protein